MAHYALEAADRVADDGISVEVVDLRTLRPLDKETVLDSVRKTGKCLVVYEDNRFGGYGAEVAAIVAEEAFDYLDGPVTRIAGPDVPGVPYNHVLEEWFMVNPEKIADGDPQARGVLMADLAPGRGASPGDRRRLPRSTRRRIGLRPRDADSTGRQGSRLLRLRQAGRVVRQPVPQARLHLAGSARRHLARALRKRLQGSRTAFSFAVRRRRAARRARGARGAVVPALPQGRLRQASPQSAGAPARRGPA